MRLGKTLVFWYLILFLIQPVLHASNTKINREEILQMHQDGLSINDIIDQIKTRGIDFEITLPVMEDMINKGVSQAVLEVLLGHDPTRRITPSHSLSPGTVKPGITVSTIPSGLSASINGISLGVTPSLSNKFQKGKHIIKVEHPLFFTRQEEVEFDGKNDLFLKWKMEPREPIVRVTMNVDRGKHNEPWSWIIRPRNHCPGCSVTLQLKSWQPIAQSGEALFLLDDESKRTFRGSGTCCLEVNIWQGEVRRDLPMRQLPPPSLRYYISDIQINGIEMLDLVVNVKVKELDQLQPEIQLQADSGYLIHAETLRDSTPKSLTYESVIETLDGVIP